MMLPIISVAGNGLLQQERTLSLIFGFLIQLSSQKFDNDGQFIKKYVPELKQSATKVYSSTKSNERSLTNAISCTFGENYPKPIVDYASSKNKHCFYMKRAKEIHQEMNNQGFNKQ